MLFDGRRCIADWGPDPYKALRDRWAAAPLAESRGDLKSDGQPAEYAATWERSAMFKDAWTAAMAGQFRGKKVLDVGAGYARQSFVFALRGAHVTHLDVVPLNLERIKKLAKHYGIEERVKTVYLENLHSAEQALRG
jgi:2-polyprenyl-3-methyl-5-hydroxy-6-metoxy-1,4-benzoquinol methylase